MGMEKGEIAQALLKHAGENYWGGRRPSSKEPAIWSDNSRVWRPPAEEIIKVVNGEHPDLIATGAKGRSAAACFLQRSVSIKLIHSECVLDPRY
ncbi:MAG: universal stress protein [Nitrospira sp.]|nr:universal stress protein [Nitrospira sp.]